MRVTASPSLARSIALARKEPSAHGARRAGCDLTGRVAEQVCDEHDMSEGCEALCTPLQHHVARTDRRVHQHDPRAHRPKVRTLGPDDLTVEGPAILVVVGGRLAPVDVAPGQAGVDVFVRTPRLRDGGCPGTVSRDAR